MKNPNNKGYHCWVSNITKRDIRLADLGVCIRSKTTLDLLSCNHSHLTVAQVKKSIENGSLKKRIMQKALFLRYSEPEAKVPRQIEISEAIFPERKRSIIVHKEPEFDELDFTLEDEANFAEETAESALKEHAARIQISTDSEEEPNE
ncbi:MAG TPA: hypothetical protein VMX17_10015 [Candidatus Glassbacteria bacterium]|nr:hypothetical protein [Candidatus Glassbacteria bacterium]